MGTAKCIGRVGALAIALGVIAASAQAPTWTVSPQVRLAADSTALIVCGAACPTPDAYVIDTVMNQYILPTHPGQTITPVAVTTPEEWWPITGVLRLVGSAVGDQRLSGPTGAVWPDEPLWKLSGLFDLTVNQSVATGVADLEAAMAEHGNDHLVIYGISAGTALLDAEKRKLAAQYPPGTTAPDIEFVKQADPYLPNGGLSSRVAGLYIPILNVTFDGPAPTDTQFRTIEINRQYDGASDFPLYPLNIVADANAILGFIYLHTNSFDVSLPADPTTSPAYQGTHGDTSYYFFPTQHLPLFDPLRTLGVPEGLIDVVEPVTRVIVEAGYDRSIPPWQPTPARLIPQVNPVQLTTDLTTAVGEGVNNAVALVKTPSKLIPTIPPPIVGDVTNLVSTLATVATRQAPTTTATPIKPAAGGLPAGPVSTVPNVVKPVNKRSNTVTTVTNSIKRASKK